MTSDDPSRLASTSSPPSGLDISDDLERAGLDAKFEVLETIGRGGMGTVVKVRHRAMDRVRALKVLHIDREVDRSTILERFRDEASIASDLSHPNIVRVFDFDFAPNGTPYMTMEYLDGEALDSLLDREGPLTVERAIELLAGVADALDRVHEHGVIHRDLKPANLFLTKSGTVKILDFGICHVERRADPLTGSDEILGTPLYMAPEQLRGIGIGARTDVYALAAVAYELITGHRSFDAPNAAVLMQKILMETPVPASDYVPELSKSVVETLEKGLAKDPVDRFASAGEFLQALAGSTSNTSTDKSSMALARSVRSQTTTTKGEKPEARGLRLWVLGAVAAIFLSTLVWIAITSTRPDGPSIDTAAESQSLALLPPIVEGGKEKDWLRTAVPALMERHLAVARVSVTPSAEVWRIVGKEAQFAPGALPKDVANRLQRETKAALAIHVRVARESDRSVLRLAAVEIATGKVVMDESVSGEGLDEPIERLTYELSTRVIGQPPPKALTPAQIARCGTEEPTCYDVIALEQALFTHGFMARARRIAERLGDGPEFALWPALVRLIPCHLDEPVPRCVPGSDFPPPPARLGAERKKLWQAFRRTTRAERNDSKELCRLSRSDDAVVRTVAQILPGYQGCGDPHEPICSRLDSFVDRILCLAESSTRDDHSTRLRYFESFVKKDYANPLLGAFGTIPMKTDLELAEKWLQRARLRAGDRDPALANVFGMLSMAQRKPTEARLWARRSQHPLQREGLALELEGQLRAGNVKALEGTARLLKGFSKIPDYVTGLILRPSISPALVTKNAVLCEVWLDALGPLRDRHPGLEGAARIVEAIQQRSASPCTSKDPSLEAFSAEVHFFCERWDRVVDAARSGSPVLKLNATSFLEAEALFHLGRVEEAEERFRNVERDPGIRSIQPIISLLALERLGAISEKRGDKKAALGHYDELLRFWNRTDVRLDAVERTKVSSKKLREHSALSR